MFPILQTNDTFKKVAPWLLDITKHPSDHREFAFSLSRKDAKYYDIQRTIQGIQLDDMKHFILHGVRAMEGTPQRCLFDGCHEIQRKQVAFSTFFSMYNRLPDVVEMLKILKPKRAEIWLVKFDERHQVLTEYGHQLMSREWAFEDAGEELKVVTGSFDYLKDMNTMVYFIFQLKIFQAFSLRPLTFPIVARFLRGIHIDPKLGKLQLIQFLFREQNNQNMDIFDGIPLLFKEEYRQSMQEMCCTGVAEYGPRIRAGIISKNGERVAIVVSRKYFKFRVVTIGFAKFEEYKEELGRIYKDIEELQLTIETTFKKKMFNE